MKKRLVVSFCLFAVLATLAYAQTSDDGFQTGTIVAFERAAADAQHMENEDYYNVMMKIGDTVYKCRTSGPAATFIDWSINKQFPAQLNEKAKTILVKSPSGETVTMNIKGKKVQK
jgi:hypothetical protein